VLPLSRDLFLRFPTVASEAAGLTHYHSPFLRYRGVENDMQKNNPVNEPSVARVIKKYPNRRLYDTTTSSYITLAEVKRLVMGRQAFTVRDAKSGEDLTRSILLQIILEEEAGGAPMFTESMLSNIIRFYGNSMQGFMGTYLEKNIQSFLDVQAKMAEQAQGLSTDKWTQLMHMSNPAMQTAMGSYVEQSKALFEQMQDQMQTQTAQMLGAMGIKR
jgi:polyhydroxyalkanoate synthesis repressor PhaR